MSRLKSINKIIENLIKFNKINYVVKSINISYKQHIYLSKTKIKFYYPNIIKQSSIIQYINNNSDKLKQLFK